MLLKTALVIVSALIPGIHCITCGLKHFTCVEDNLCLPKYAFCNRSQECPDGSDENYCYYSDVSFHGGCPSIWMTCEFGRKCVPPTFKCDGENDCFYGLDESLCGYRAKPLLRKWFVDRLKEEFTVPDKSHELYRTAIALHLSDKSFFASGNKIGEEVASKVELQLLTSLTSQFYLKRNEMPLSIHALIVTCKDPRDFHGFNLVAELRRQMAKDYLQVARPYELLALCNAHDVKLPQDAQKAAEAFISKNITFTTDNNALALQALACIRTRTNSTLDGTNMTAMEDELKRGQFENGTLGNLRTTALVLQALIASQSYRVDFNFDAALEAILKQQTTSGSFGSIVDSNYVMPLLSEASFLGINNSHCKPSTKNESNASNWTQNRNERVSYSIKIGEEEQKTRILYVPVGSSFYDVIELVNVLDSSQRVQYHVVDGKPYVWSLKDVEEDLEMNLYWYIYRDGFHWIAQALIEKSPVDVKIFNNDEFLLWYK